MNTEIFKVRHDTFIPALSEYLRTNKTVVPIKNFDIIKTSRGKETSPLDINWYYTRAASIIRKLLISKAKNEKPLSIVRFSSEYGCAKDRGNRPNKHVRASKGIIIKILNDLQEKGWVEKKENGWTLKKEAEEVSKQLIEKLIN
nr:Chain ST0, 40S Ribosomal protein S19 [Spraguea lophii 42_110]7QJH_RT0 Chain RT0, 40S Ribosomal protein S19 [Spraguea lophii 42_110]7QJH_ST0 Chain ST0, 40S Ribosomal protein S19 [Spraguea lophii 42_110]8BR3_ST0 Chain ST0, 40S Ribosomal protein S19 [Spraguea lophii 42_110]8P5D_ST0 Chain ST0, 40S Ribosomal protein S19 [Spraguea lophii 42_110]8P60_RT0 Chain RT0, 40S Ribosomal protein S19 [Spraguea lophii 42_110]8P60_ST0 Chain ST0, 40S Ribosomal protein S19 [Spraguea lophii 42_110]